MLESAWLFVGTIAFLWTTLAVAAMVYADANNAQADGLVSNAGVIGFVLWGVWTFGTLQIEVVDNGTTLAFTHPELTILGIALALVPGYIALTGPIELIARVRDPETDTL